MLQPSAITKIYIIIYLVLMSYWATPVKKDLRIETSWTFMTPVAAITLNIPSLPVPLHSNVPHHIILYVLLNLYTNMNQLSWVQGMRLTSYVGKICIMPGSLRLHSSKLQYTHIGMRPGDVCTYISFHICYRYQPLTKAKTKSGRIMHTPCSWLLGLFGNEQWLHYCIQGNPN